MTPVHLVENQTEARAPEDTKFSQTQIEIILRKGVIYPVIDLLNLLDQWSQNGKRLSHEAAYNKLRGMLKLEGVRNYEPDSDHRQCPSSSTSRTAGKHCRPGLHGTADWRADQHHFE